MRAKNVTLFAHPPKSWEEMYGSSEPAIGYETKALKHMVYPLKVLDVPNQFTDSEGYLKWIGTSDWTEWIETEMEKYRDELESETDWEFEILCHHCKLLRSCHDEHKRVNP